MGSHLANFKTRPLKIMKKTISCYFYLSLFLFVFSTSAQALSAAEFEKLSQNSPDLKEAQVELSEAWKTLKTVASPEDLERYTESQERWTKTELKEEAESILEKFRKEGKAPESVLLNGQVDLPKIYTQLIKERTIILQELVKQTQDKNYLPKFVGRMVLVMPEPDSGGDYCFVPENWLGCAAWIGHGDTADLSEAANKAFSDIPEGALMEIRGCLDSQDSFRVDDRMSFKAVK